MRKLLAIVLAVSTLHVTAQKNFNDAIKVNLSGLIVKNISLQYERKLSKRLSAALAYRNLPYGTVPFSSSLSNSVSGSGIDFSKMNVGSSAVTPELRLYVGKKGAMRGFYLGLFSSFSNYKTDFPITFSDRTGTFNGTMKATTFGLQLGTQMRISHRFFLDWWILGPNIGKANGNMNLLTANLNANEQQALRDNLQNVKDNAPFAFVQSFTVDSNGAVVNLNGPWGGVRALGFNLSFHF